MKEFFDNKKNKIRKEMCNRICDTNPLPTEFCDRCMKRGAIENVINRKINTIKDGIKEFCEKYKEIMCEGCGFECREKCNATTKCSYFKVLDQKLKELEGV